MNLQITIAIIGAIPALITATVSIALNNRVLKLELENIKERLGRIEKKQDDANHVRERVAILERDNKTAFNRIDELREDIRNIN